MRQLCLEAATAATLPPAEEAALLGTPPGMGADAAHAELELELLIKKLATAAALPPAEEAALLGTPPGMGAAALVALAAPPVVDEASLPRPLAILRCKPEGHPEATETVFYLLGTAHISEQSCADVARLVRTVRPQVRFCPGVSVQQAPRDIMRKLCTSLMPLGLCSWSLKTLHIHCPSALNKCHSQHLPCAPSSLSSWSCARSGQPCWQRGCAHARRPWPRRWRWCGRARPRPSPSSTAGEHKCWAGRLWYMLQLHCAAEA